MKFKIFNSFEKSGLKAFGEEFTSGTVYGTTEHNEVTSLVKIAPVKGNGTKAEFTDVFFENENHCSLLHRHIMEKYANKGTKIFIAKVDDKNEKIKTFYSKVCGFSFCSGISTFLTKDTDFSENAFDTPDKFDNSDAEEICAMYNDGLNEYFAPLLSKNPDEFKTTLFCGLETVESFVLRNNSGKITGMFGIDFKNSEIPKVFIILPSPYEDFYEDVLQTIRNVLKQKNKSGIFYVIHENFLSHSSKYEEILRKHESEKIRDTRFFIKTFTVHSKFASVFLKDILFGKKGTSPAFFSGDLSSRASRHLRF